MKLGMTMMVRDEADIIATTVNYAIDQGVDVILVTDNGSRDGTTEILEQFANAGEIELEYDPVHRKQQSSVVTAMARRLSTDHQVDWVINADADEFLVPHNRELRLRDAFQLIPPAVQSFMVPVVNMVGPLARRGIGLDRLVWRDQRSPAQLAEVGLAAQPTGDAIHVGRDDVRVAQGNHAVSIANHGEVPAEASMEVLHFPWRSWEQYEHRALVSGRAYQANPAMKPSPSHHGMTDFGRLEAGVLLPYLAARLPSLGELRESSAFSYDATLLSRVRPVEATTLRSEAFPSEMEELARRTGLALIARDRAAEAKVHDLETVLLGIGRERSLAQSQLDAALDELDRMHRRKSVRISDALTRSVRRFGAPRKSSR